MTKHSPAALEMARKIGAAFAKGEHANLYTDVASIIDAGNAEIMTALKLFSAILGARNDAQSKGIVETCNRIVTKYSVPK